jgi:hypothetical protein
MSYCKFRSNTKGINGSLLNFKEFTFKIFLTIVFDKIDI